jgi:aspartyl/asparaginyl-tRNA synthetase
MSNSDYSYVINKLKDFFTEYGFLEVEAQSNQSILSACENPKSVMTYQLDGNVWPLKQTNQMELEKVLLTNKKLEKIFCVTTSYRDEMLDEMEENRHLKIFPMFEFESLGDFGKLVELEKDLLVYLGLAENKNQITELGYVEIVKKYSTNIIDSKTEEKMQKQYGNNIILTNFPRYSDPFWNMKQSKNSDNIFKKADVILFGMETIGSAERSCQPTEMIDNFYSLCKGQYAQLLFNKFGKERVLKELDDFCELEMVERFGGGIGISRLIRAMKLKGLMN